MLHQRLRVVKQWFSSQRLVGVIVVIAIAGLGVYLLGSSRALSPYASNEAESGNLGNGAIQQTSSSASGGNFVKFGGSCSGVQIAAGADIQTALNANPAGTTFCLAAATYRITTPLAPSNNQQLIGVAGQTDLNGSKVVSGFSQSSSLYSATGFLPNPPTPAYDDQCLGGVSGCGYNEAVYLDSKPLLRVMSLSALTAGHFYEDYGANKIYLADNPNGHTIEQAVAPVIIESGASGVVVKNLIVEKAADRAQKAAINAGNNGATGWDVENNEVRLNHSYGVMVDAGIIKNNHIHDNGQLGADGHLAGGTMSYNEIDHNGSWANFNPGWEAGGAKFAVATNWVFANNNAHDNSGAGLWCDESCNGVIFENNTVTNNDGGIFYEISYNGIIRNNTATNNGPATTNGFFTSTNILVSASPNTEVYGNTVSGANGIGLLQQNRSGSAAPYGPHEDHDDYVHDNIIIIKVTPSYAAGLSQDVGDQTYFTSRNNRFVHNTYYLPDQTSAWFTWMDTNLTKTGWMNFGQDTTGSFLAAVPVTLPFHMAAGESIGYTDSSNTIWIPDQYAAGGGTDNQAAGHAITGTSNQQLYQSEHWGMNSYNIPVANGTHTVKLHFAEIYSGCQAVGCRVFNVTAEGQPVITNLDIFKEVGGYAADDKTFTVNVTNGSLDIGFSATANSPTISGIEIQ